MWLSQFIPSRITPCVLTCLGLAINLGSCLILLYYSPDAKAEVSSTLISFMLSVVMHWRVLKIDFSFETYFNILP